MKILVTGAGGQLASEIRDIVDAASSDIGPIPDLYQGAQFDFASHADLDISDASAVVGWFEERGPYDLVINCASFTNVDGCEENEALAYKVNALGAYYLAGEVEKCRGKLVHISTDYVFPGTERSPRSEGDLACPISAYGRSKWAGEVLVASACSHSYIVRTAWLYGRTGSNFVRTMLRLAVANGTISVVNDQFGNPTYANDLAHEILRISATDSYGLYHCTSEGTCSWYDFACAIVDSAGIECEREGISSDEYKKRFPKSASRPAFSSLDNARLKETIGNQMRSWQNALASFMEKGGPDAVE